MFSVKPIDPEFRFMWNSPSNMKEKHNQFRQTKIEEMHSQEPALQ